LSSDSSVRFLLVFVRKGTATTDRRIDQTIETNTRRIRIASTKATAISEQEMSNVSTVRPTSNALDLLLDIALRQLSGHVHSTRDKDESLARERCDHSGTNNVDDEIQKSTIESRRIDKIIGHV
jgi:hypothetical protein